MKGPTVGILALQGDIAENAEMTKDAARSLGYGVSVRYVKRPHEIADIDALIIGGGESTAIGSLSLLNGSLKEIKQKIESGMPVFGICAGLVLLSRQAHDKTVGSTGQPLLELLDIVTERNSYGGQRSSFESPLKLDAIKGSGFNGVFIRAPSIASVGPGVEVLARLDDRPVAVRQKNILATTFHPELTRDPAFHRYFIDMIPKN